MCLDPFFYFVLEEEAKTSKIEIIQSFKQSFAGQNTQHLFYVFDSLFFGAKTKFYRL